MATVIDPVQLAISMMFLFEPTDRALEGWCPPRRMWRNSEKNPDPENEVYHIKLLITREEFP